MLVSYTPIASLPADVRSRLQARLAAQPLMMGTEPMMFEGFHLAANEIQLAQRIAKNSSTPGSGTPLFG
jgi:hypothetical protein